MSVLDRIVYLQGKRDVVRKSINNVCFRVSGSDQAFVAAEKFGVMET
ncbi:MAG: hypothetical protein GXY43_04010 [Clostridiaceae bacterium]|jgi:hypothetical protein|nr:hypothetical protein [Clostridiaceae bacterium]